ncbi:MAG: rod shape-determining protein MreC [bacterium]|nr:rod shape-determining protein MreC [bacterium]
MPNRIIKNIIIAILVVVVVMVVNNRLVGQGLKRMLLGLIERPLASSYMHLGSIQWRITSLFKVEGILKENLSLVEENKVLRVDNLKLADLIKENEFLREELGVAKEKGYDLEIARIFHFTTDGQARTALIDKGAEEGVAALQPVIFGGNILLGIVKEVYPHHALIYLTTDPRLAMNVKITDSPVSGRTRGALNQGLFLELVTNQDEIKEGQTVVTSGLDGLPSLLLVGRVSNVQTKSGELFKTVRIDPEYGNLLLDKVFILKSK